MPDHKLHITEGKSRVLSHPAGRGVTHRMQRRASPPPARSPARTCGRGAITTPASAFTGGWTRHEEGTALLIVTRTEVQVDIRVESEAQAGDC